MITSSLIAVIAAVVGAGFGALLTYHLQGKARDKEHALTIERMKIQGERAAASASDEALARLEPLVLDGPHAANQLHDEWTTEVRPKALLIDAEELSRRIELIGEVLRLAHQTAGRDELWRRTAGTSVEDARAWLTAFLRGQEAPAPRTPTIEHIEAALNRNGPQNLFLGLHAERIFRDEEATRTERHPQALALKPPVPRRLRATRHIG